MFHRVSTGAALFVILGLATGVASAQETRAEMLEQERAAKAQALATYEPVKLERWMLWFEDVQPLAKLAPHNGFYARYGFQWRPTGSGVGMGIDGQPYLRAGDVVELEITGLGSSRQTFVQA